MGPKRTRKPSRKAQDSHINKQQRRQPPVSNQSDSPAKELDRPQSAHAGNHVESPSKEVQFTSSSMTDDVISDQHKDSNTLVEKSQVMPYLRIQKYDWIISERERYPLLWSAYTGDLARLQRKLKKVKDATQVKDAETSTSILGWAVAGDQVTIIKYLFERYPQLLTLSNRFGASPLFLCSVSGNVDMFKLLVGKGLSPYKRTAKQDNVLMLTAARGHLDLTRYIVETYHDMLRETAECETDVFLMSCYSGRVDMFNYMMQLNFDPSVSDIDGINCRMIAEWCGHELLLRHIIEYCTRFGINIHPTVVKDEPREMIDEYLRLFTGPKEKYRHIRVVFVGPENVGKTTLCLRLQGKAVDISVRRPTLGAELFLQLYEIGWDSKRWTHLDTDRPEVVIHKRLGEMLRNALVVADNTGNNNSENQAMPSTADTAPVTHQSEIGNQQGGNFARKVSRESEKVYRQSNQQVEGVAFLSMWDMGGDLAFQATNSVFVSAHGVYVVTFRAIDYFTDDMQMGRLKNWVRNIGAYSSRVYNPSKLRPHHPPIIVVGTHMDQVNTKFKHVTRQQNEEMLGSMRIKMCSITELTNTNVKKFKGFAFLRFCTVDSSIHDDPALEKIRGYILEAAEYQDQWERELPGTWLAMEREILKKQKWKHVLSFQEIKDMDSQCESPIGDEEEIKMFLEYLHSTRSVLYFRKYGKVIINPQWVINAFREILTDEKFLPSDDLLLTADLIKYSRNALLTVDLAKTLWKSKEEDSFTKHVDILFAFLEEFGLLVKAYLGQDKEGKPIYDNDYTVPSKLKKAPDVNHIASLLKAKGTVCSRTLCFVFEDDFTPQELFERIYAGVIKAFRPAEKAFGTSPSPSCQVKHIYKGLGCFQVDDLCNMVVRAQWEQSVIAVTLFTTSEPRIPDDTGTKVRQKLEKIIHHTLEISRQEHLEYRNKLHCRYYLERSDSPREGEGIVKAENGLPCHEVGCSGTHILTKHDWHVWFPDIATKTGTNQNTVCGNTTRACVSKLLTDKGLQEHIADKLGYNWECVMTRLCVSRPTLDRINLTHPRSPLTQMTNALIHWRDNYPVDSSEEEMLRDLSKAFREFGADSDVIDDQLELFAM